MIMETTENLICLVIITAIIIASPLWCIQYTLHDYFGRILEKIKKRESEEQ